MQIPLTEIEQVILDQLADGGVPLSLLLRALREGTRVWDPAAIISGLSRLVERQLIHYSRTPGGPIYTSPASELIHAQVLGALNNLSQMWWLELTEDGEAAWEQRQQSHRGS